MVRFKFIWLFSTFCIASQAQEPQNDYRIFAQEGKIWENQIGVIQENVYGHFIDGDTLINGENWMKVINYIGRRVYNNSYYAAIRDVGKKVYAIAKGSRKPRLLYDFSLNVGDMVRCGVEGNAFGCLLEADETLDTLYGFRFVSYLKVERIDTIKVRGFSHRRFTLTLLDSFKEPFLSEDGDMDRNVVWIEGVGSGAGPFFPWTPLPPRGSILQSCDVGQTCIFAYPDFYNDDDINGIDIPRSIQSGNNVFFNLYGLRILNPPTKGIYIQNGKKILNDHRTVP